MAKAIPDTKGPIMTTSPQAGRYLALARQATVSGSLASLFSVIALIVRGRRDAGSAIAPLNAPSHWLFGREALQADRPSWRHTLTGLLIHQGSSMMWGVLYDQLFCKQRKNSNVAALAAGAVGFTAAAALVDLKLVPNRLTPGFEHRLSRKSLLITYGAFAAGLTLSGILLSRQRNG